MKTKEELDKIKEEAESLNRKMSELTDEELEEVAGGMKIMVVDDDSNWFRKFVDFLFKIRK